MNLRLPTAALLSALTAGVAAQNPERPPQEPPSPPAEDSGPWRLDDALGTPDWLHFSGHVRLRWEGIDGQFRSSPRLDANDHYAVSRTALRTDVDLDPFGATVELLDSRHYGAGTGSHINNSIVNPIDFLQAYGEVDLGRYGAGSNRLRVGRETLDLGSRRLVARNNFRNTIRTFDGIDWLWQGDGDTSFRAFWTMPVLREPRNSELNHLLDNDPELDEQDLDYQFWGAFLQTGKTRRTQLEAYLYGLNDSRTSARQRDLYTPGVRILHKPRPRSFDYQLEGALQFGESRLSTTGSQDLDHLAWMMHASVGYSFDAPWNPHLQVAWDYASGDDNPGDGDNNRFDNLQGSRSFDFGPTGIYGPIARANLNSPELRLDVEPTPVTSARLAWRGIWLAESRDAWPTARIQDPTGSSGTDVGHEFYGEFVWDLVPDSLQLEIGGAVLLAGDYQEEAPGGQGRDTYYGYTQMVFTF